MSKVLLRTKVIICSIAIGIGILYIIIGLNIYDKYEVFNEKVESNYEAKVINNIKGNEKYLLEFDIDSKAINDKEDMYTINLIERDEKNKIVNQTDIKFGTCSGIKQIELVTKETTKEIKIEFKSEYTYRSKKLIVNKLFINQQETPLKYKYLPTLLVEKIQSININYKTAKERIEMIKNALELAKESILTGIGGDGWQYKYEEVQNYSYISSKLHSYPAKIALEFGIIGIVSYIGLAIITLILCIKEVRKQNIAIISITFAFILLGLHSIIDLDMEYTAILIYALCLTGMLAKEYTNKNNSKIQYLSNIAFIIIMSISIYLTTNLNSYNKYVDISNELEKRNGLFIASEEYKMANYKIAQKYEELSYYERYNQLNNYKKIVEYYLESNSENKVEIIEKYVIKIANYEIRTKYNVNKIISKIETEYSIIKELEKQNDPQYNKIIEKMRDIILNECDSAKKKIEQCAKIQRKNYDLYLDELSHIYKSIN